MIRINIILFVLAGFITFSCNKEETINLSGDITGFVDIINEQGEVVEDKSGIEIAIENTSCSAVTDEIGKYEIKDVPAGTYNILYTADSCGVDKYLTFQHVGGNISAFIDKQKLYKIPTYDPDTIKVNYYNGLVEITVEFKYPSQEYYARFYFSNSPDVSIENYQYYSFVSTDGNNGYISAKYGGFDIDYTDLDEDLPIYYVIYQFNYYGSYAGYYDYEKEKTVYTCYRKVSEVKELVTE